MQSLQREISRTRIFAVALLSLVCPQDLQLESSFTSELPGDPILKNRRRQVLPPLSLGIRGSLHLSSGHHIAGLQQACCTCRWKALSTHMHHLLAPTQSLTLWPIRQACPSDGRIGPALCAAVWMSTPVPCAGGARASLEADATTSCMP